MRNASLTQERRESLIAVLPDEHFGIKDVKRVFVRHFPTLHFNEHRESDGHSRRPTTLDHRQRIRDENRHRTHVDTAVLSRLVHEWADTESVDDETDVNSADLQGFVRSELEALSAGINDFFQRSVECFYSRVLKIRECGDGIVSCPRCVGNYSCSAGQDEGQERRQGLTCSLIFWNGKGKWRKPNSAKHLARQVSCEKVQVNVSRMWTTWSIGDLARRSNVPRS